MITPEEIALARHAIDHSLALGAQKVRVTLNKSLMELVGTLDGQIDKVSHCLDRSLTIALFVEGRYGSFSINRMEEAVLDAFLERAVDTVRMLASDACRDLPDPARKATDAVTGEELGLYDPAYASLDIPRRREMALGASIYAARKAAGESDFTLLSEEGEYSDSIFDSVVIDSEGLFCRHRETSFEYGVEMTVEDASGNRYSGYWWDAAPFLKDLQIGTCCATALERAAAQIGPQPHPGGSCILVVQSECASKLVTPLLNALGGYALQQKNSFLDGSLGKRLFPEGFTLTEACRTPGQTGSRLFDSEGVATQETPIIEDGVVRRYFLNTYIAAKLGMEPTVEDAICPAILPWIVPGHGPVRRNQDEILRLCGEGILVTGFNGGNSNSSTGDFSYGIEGFAFKDGKICHPVREMLMTGNFLTLWNNLLAAGCDARACSARQIPTLAFKNVDISS